MRAGDIVRHKPTGEKWVVAYVDGEYLSPCGWPPCEAPISDCELIEPASDDEHRHMLEQWVAIGRRRGPWYDAPDRRAAICAEQLYLLDQAFIGEHI